VFWSDQLPRRAGGTLKGPASKFFLAHTDSWWGFRKTASTRIMEIRKWRNLGALNTTVNLFVS